MSTLTEHLVDTSGEPLRGLVLRPYRGPQDHPAMTDVANAVGVANGENERRTVATMNSYYGSLEHADLPKDCAIVELDGRVVAYGRVSWEELAGGGREIQGILNIHPELAGRGIEDLLIGHALARTQVLIPEIGADDETSLKLQVTARDKAQLTALEAAGFERIRSGAELVRPSVADVPDVALPDGYDVRPIDAADEAMHRRIWEAAKRAFADSFGETVSSEKAYEAWRQGEDFQPELWEVAFHGEDVAGQILNYLGPVEPDGGRIGWTESISVQPEHRRRGLARALLARSIRRVAGAGATRAALGVDLQNPNQAVDLYQSLGFRIVGVSYEYRLGPFPPGSRPTLVSGSDA